MSIHDQRVFHDWVRDVLVAGGVAVGRGVAPASVPPGEGYAVIYGIAGGITAGSLDAPRSDADGAAVQVTSVGDREEQAAWTADKVRTLVDAAVPATLSDGRRVIWLDFPMASITVLRDDDVQPPVWSAPDRFTVGTVPA